MRLDEEIIEIINGRDGLSIVGDSVLITPDHGQNHDVVIAATKLYAAPEEDCFDVMRLNHILNMICKEIEPSKVYQQFQESKYCFQIGRLYFDEPAGKLVTTEKMTIDDPSLRRILHVPYDQEKSAYIQKREKPLVYRVILDVLPGREFLDMYKINKERRVFFKPNI